MALAGLDGRFIRTNRALSDILGYPREQLIAKTFTDITHPDDLQAGVGAAERLASGATGVYQTEKRYIHASGRTIWARLSVSLVRDAHEAPQGLIAQIQDISDQKLLEQGLRHLADHDSLTGLANRRFLEEQLELEIVRCQRYSMKAGLLMFDLDGFKKINDEHGHKAGDAVLKAVAARMQTRIRTTDLLARIGGDEFALLLRTDAGEAPAIAGELRRCIAACPVETPGPPIQLDVSIGIATIDQLTTDGESALATADNAMYRDKRRRQRNPPHHSRRRGPGAINRKSRATPAPDPPPAE